MKSALVTGGSSGLGFEMARQLAAQGYHVVIVAREAKKIEKTVGIIQREGFSAIGFQGDITNHIDLKQVAKYLTDHETFLDFLILNAGVVHVRLLTDYEKIEEMKQDIETDLWGTILSARTFVPFLRADSKVLFISSGFGLVGAAGYSIYCAAKAGVINFAEALRRELYHKQIAVYVACPGDIDTPQYNDEYHLMPDWMVTKRTKWSSVISPEVAAKRILKKCSGKRFILTSDAGIASLMMAKKMLPSRVASFILDKIFPMPERNG